MISIILPYLTANKCIDLFRKIIAENTTNEYEIIEIADQKDVYGSFNEGAKLANGDLLIFMNDDIFVSKGWDELYVKYVTGKTVGTGYLVEPGVAPVSYKNLEKDFGRTPTSYRHEDFMNWCDKEKSNTPEILQDTKGWYLPMAIKKEFFVDFPNEQKFPHPNDILLVDDLLPRLCYTFIMVASFAYHLQGYSHIKDNRS